MSEWDIVLGFLIGVVVGAYGCWLGRDIIATGVALMKMQKEENKRCEAEEKKANAENQPTPEDPAFYDKQNTEHQPQV
jgi:hypothetical protein